MIGSAIAEYNVAVSSELHWLFLLDFKWSFLLVFVWLFSPGSNSRIFLLVILFLYLTTVYMSTVVSRRYNPGMKVDLRSFISWSRAYAGDRHGIKMLIENLIMLMPVGFLMPFVYRRKKVYIRTISFGFLFSLFIETSQYLRKTGLFEVDDLINNTVGVVVGFGVASLILKVLQLIKKHLVRNNKEN